MTNVVLNYSCASSESIKPLSKLIPLHCICGAEDTIPGLLSGRLPHGSGFIRIELTASYSLRFQLLLLEVPESVGSDAIRLGKGFFQSRSKSTFKEVRIAGQFLRISFHNGWVPVSTCDLDLERKQSGEVNSRNLTYKASQYEADKLGILQILFIEPNTVVSVELMFKLEAIYSDSSSSLDYAVAARVYSLEGKDTIRSYVS